MRKYESLVLSVIDNGSIIYGAAPESILKSLDPIHNLGIRISIGAFKTSILSKRMDKSIFSCVFIELGKMSIPRICYWVSNIRYNFKLYWHI
jgi:hypothetical protein